jgi:hypothetical protein
MTNVKFIILILGLVISLPEVARSQDGFGETKIDTGDASSVASDAPWAGKMSLSTEVRLAPKVTDAEALIEAGLSTSGIKLFHGGIGPSGKELPREIPSRHNLWEVELFPGTFSINTTKAPEDIKPGETHYLTVSFGTPDNVQYVSLDGKTLSKTRVFGPFEVKPVRQAWKVDGNKEKRTSLLNDGLPNFDFTLDQKTVVFFTTFRTVARSVKDGKGSKPWWDPGPRPDRYKTVFEDFRCPIFLRWVPEEKLYRLEVETLKGEFDLQDWHVTVSYKG